MSSIALALTGITQAQTQFAGAAERLSRAAVSNDPGADSVDLSSEIVALLGARNGVALSVAVAHVAQDTEKSLLTLFG